MFLEIEQSLLSRAADIGHFGETSAACIPKLFFFFSNEVWLKVGNREYIYIDEIKFGNKKCSD